MVFDSLWIINFYITSLLFYFSPLLIPSYFHENRPRETEKKVKRKQKYNAKNNNNNSGILCAISCMGSQSEMPHDNLKLLDVCVEGKEKKENVNAMLLHHTKT